MESDSNNHLGDVDVKIILTVTAQPLQVCLRGHCRRFSKDIACMHAQCMEYVFKQPCVCYDTKKNYEWRKFSVWYQGMAASASTE